MRTILTFLLLVSPALAADPQVRRDLAYAEPKNELQTLDACAAAEGKKHGTINSDLGLPDDKPTQAMWKFLDGVLNKK